MPVPEGGPDYDVVIVGGGPAGLSAALVLGRCRRRVLVLDDEDPRNARAHHMHGFLSREGISPWELRRIARAQLEPFDVELRRERATDARCIEVGFAITTARGIVTGRKLVLATGMRDEVPAIEGIEPLLGSSVHFCPYCHGWECRDRALAAYARGGDEAVEFALGLTTWSRDVILFTDGEVLGSAAHETLGKNGVAVREARITRLEADAAEPPQLTAVVLEGGDVVPRGSMFVHAGRSQRSDLPAKLGVVFAPDSTVLVGTCEVTNVPGLWVVGDASRDVQFAIVAAAEGAKAAYAINRELRAELCR